MEWRSGTARCRHAGRGSLPAPVQSPCAAYYDVCARVGFVVACSYQDISEWVMTQELKPDPPESGPPGTYTVRLTGIEGAVAVFEMVGGQWAGRRLEMRLAGAPEPAGADAAEAVGESTRPAPDIEGRVYVGAGGFVLIGKSTGPAPDIEGAARQLAARRRRLSLVCEECGIAFTGRSGQRYCGQRCRQRAAYHRNKGAK